MNEYTVIVKRDGETVTEQIFSLQSEVTDPAGRYTLSKADIKTKADTFGRAVQFAAQAHANLLHVESIVASQSTEANARRQARAIESAEKKLVAARAIVASAPATEATATS